MLRSHFLSKRLIEYHKLHTVYRTSSSVLVESQTNSKTPKTKHIQHKTRKTNSKDNTFQDLDISDKELLQNKTFYLKTYGCQMNLSDSDIVRYILQQYQIIEQDNESTADVILTNTCAMREEAEGKLWNRLHDIKHNRKEW